MKRFRFWRSSADTFPATTYAFFDLFSSRIESLPFSASVRIEWFRDQAHNYADASPQRAAHIVREMVEPLAKKGDVLRARAIEDEIFVELTRLLPLRVDGLVISNVVVALSVEDDVVDAARKMEHLRRELELDELARRQARARYAFFRDAVLADPGTARLYASIGIPKRVGRLPEEDLDKLVRAVKEWHPDTRWIVIAQILSDFLNKLSENGRKELLTVLDGAIATLGSEEQVAQLRRALTMADS